MDRAYKAAGQQLFSIINEAIRKFLTLIISRTVSWSSPLSALSVIIILESSSWNFALWNPPRAWRLQRIFSNLVWALSNTSWSPSFSRMRKLTNSIRKPASERIKKNMHITWTEEDLPKICFQTKCTAVSGRNVNKHSAVQAQFCLDSSKKPAVQFVWKQRYGRWKNNSIMENYL